MVSYGTWQGYRDDDYEEPTRHSLRAEIASGIFLGLTAFALLAVSLTLIALSFTDNL
jgi:hypothetical protein